MNVTGTFNVCHSVRDAGFSLKVVSASPAAIYGNQPGLPKREEMAPDALSLYTAGKLMNEYDASLFFRLYGVETVCLRYFNVYGPRQDPASDLRGSHPEVHLATDGGAGAGTIRRRGADP